MRYRRGPLEINPGLYGIKVNGQTGNECIKDSRLVFQLPPEMVNDKGRIEIGPGEELTYTREESSLSFQEGYTHYECVSEYIEGDFFLRERSFHPFSEGVYKIKLNAIDAEVDFGHLGYLNVFFHAPAWYAMNTDSQLPIIIESDQELSYKYIRGPCHTPEEFQDFLGETADPQPYLSYNVRVTERRVLGEELFTQRSLHCQQPVVS